MSKLWSFALLFVVCLGLLYGQPSQPPTLSAVEQTSQKRDIKPNDAQSHTQTDVKGTQKLPIWDDANCPGCRQTSSAEGTYESNEKPAKRRRDDPNWWVAWLTGVLVTVACVQAGFFVWQLRMMRKSLADSKIAAEAARDAATAAKQSADIASHSERAWVVDEIRQMGNLPANGEVFAVYMSFKNFGRTPALIVDLKIRLHTFQLEDTDPLIGAEVLPEFPAYDHEQNFFEVGDQGIILVPTQSFTVAQSFEEEGGKWTQFLQLVVPTKQRRLCCYGLISYEDGFGNLRTNQFCYIWDLGFDPKGVIPNFRRFGPSHYNHAT